MTRSEAVIEFEKCRSDAVTVGNSLVDLDTARRALLATEQGAIDSATAILADYPDLDPNDEVGDWSADVAAQQSVSDDLAAKVATLPDLRQQARSGGQVLKQQ